MSDTSLLIPGVQYVYVDDGPAHDDPAAQQGQFSGAADAYYVFHFDAPPQGLADGDIVFVGATIPGGANTFGGGGPQNVLNLDHTATVSIGTNGGPSATTGGTAVTGAATGGGLAIPGVPLYGGASGTGGATLPGGGSGGATISGGSGGTIISGSGGATIIGGSGGLTAGDGGGTITITGSGGLTAGDGSHASFAGFGGGVSPFAHYSQYDEGIGLSPSGYFSAFLGSYGSGGVFGVNGQSGFPSLDALGSYGSLFGGNTPGFGNSSGIFFGPSSGTIFRPTPSSPFGPEQNQQGSATDPRPVDISHPSPVQTSGETLDLSAQAAAQYVDLDPASGGAHPRDTAYYESAANHANAGTTLDDPAQVHAVTASVTNVTGTAYADVIHGSSAANDISAGGGDDTILGSAGNDTIHGGDGHNTLDYGAFDNDHPLTVTGANDGAGTVSFTGGSQIFSGITTISGGAGNDAIDLHTWTQAAHISGGPGNDVLRGGAGSDTIEGGPGDDTIRGSFGDDVIHGDAGHNTLDYSTFDSAHPIVVSGTADGAGSTSVDGPQSIHQTFTGITTLIGGDGDDRIDLSVWSSGAHVSGGAGADIITGGAGGDSLEGGAGDDTFHISAGADTIIGGAGANTIDGSAFENGSVSVTGTTNGAGHVVVGGHDTQTFSDIGTFIGTTANDTIDLHTWTQAACIDGGGGSGDSLTGGSGNDTLVAGDAATLTGGDGADVFHFRGAPVSPTIIDDFSHGVDKLAFLTTGGFPGLGGQWSFATVSDGTSHSGSAATATLTYDTSDHTLYYDADGIGGGSPEALAVIRNNATVDASDIVVTHTDVAVHG
jgi:Ca2+-binding RTX toxin-like protein